MNRLQALRVLAPLLAIAVTLAACGSAEPGRGNLGPRGSALPPPDPVTGAERSSLPVR
jgi:hypothetical protein